VSVRLAIDKRRVALALVVGTASVMAAPASAGAAGLGGLSVRPAHFDPAKPASRAYFTRAVPRGGSFTDAVVVSNTSSAPLTVYVYPVDGLTGVTTGSVYANRQDGRNRAGKWLRVATRTLRVTAHREVAVAFTARVPSSARAGDHLAGIAVENAVPVHSAGKFSVTEVTRAVVGVLVTVPGAAKPSLQLAGLALRPLPGTSLASVVVTLGDTGGKLCKPTLKIALGGQTVQRRLDTILPGDRIDFPFPWPHRLGAGTYATTATGSGCGATTVMRASTHLGTTLVGANGRVDQPAAAKPASSTPWWPLPLVAIGGLLAGALFTRRAGRAGRGGGSSSSDASGS
jgi:hypothetical protein